MNRNGSRGANPSRYTLRRRMYSSRELTAPVQGLRSDTSASPLIPPPSPPNESVNEEVQALRETVLRQRAEFENFRKRTQREKEQIREIAAEALLSRLLPVLDNLDRAMEGAKTAADVSSVREGVSMISQQLARALEAEGLEQVKALHQPFDPSIHDALAAEDCDDVPDGHVFAVLLPGYTYKTRLLRPAMVKVARKPQP